MPLQLTPEDLAKVADKQLANILRKVQEGKTLTAREDARLAAARPGADAGSSPTTLPGYAANWNDLALALGITRRALSEWRRDPRYKPHCPPDRADGRKEIAAWLTFMRAHNLAGAAAQIPLPGDPEREHDDDTPAPEMPPLLGGTQAEWKAREIKLKGDRIQIELDQLRRTLLSAAELEAPLGATFVAITNQRTQLPERLAPLVAGFTDIPEIIAIIRAETEAGLTILNAADYLTDIRELVGDLPTDAETTRLLALVTFSGQDHRALIELLAHLITIILRRIGERVITAISAPPVPDAITGQTSDESEKSHAEEKNSPAPAAPRPRKRSAPSAIRSDATAPAPRKPRAKRAPLRSTGKSAKTRPRAK